MGAIHNSFLRVMHYYGNEVTQLKREFSTPSHFSQCRQPFGWRLLFALYMNGPKIPLYPVTIFMIDSSWADRLKFI